MKDGRALVVGAPAVPIEIVHDIPGRLRLRTWADAGMLQAIEEVAGVTSVRANPACRSVVVTYDGGGTRAEILKAAGRGPLSLHPIAPPPDPVGPDPIRVVLAGAVFVGAFLLPPPWRAALTWVNVADVLVRGIRVLTTEGIKVDVLDAIAIGLPVLRGEFATANFARFLLELGGWIEASTARRSDDLLEKLLQAEPATVWIERQPDGRVIEVPYRSLAGGEWVVVGTGQLVPVDGVVVSGAATVDQASVTGESLPIPKSQGDPVLSGTVIQEGRLVVMAEKVGEATTMARISRTIREALTRPSQIQCVSRQMADRRVMITLLSGAMVFALTRDVRRLESVFLVDYACAVKFGTPIAVKAALYRAARSGCLVKGGQAIETLAQVDTVVFDKTGTLTENTLEVTDILCLRRGMDEGDLLALVASVAEHTTHPIAAAVVALARRRQVAHITHEEVDFIIGHGVASRVGGQVIRLGSRHYLEDDEGIPFHDEAPLIERLTAEGKALLFVSADGAPLGVIALRDRVRPEAADVLARLRRQGVREIIMITGDARAKAEAMGEALGLDRVFAERHPEDKAAIVETLKAEGRRVAFVGDGVNDGPALAAADVGIAMPQAADIARATADMVLMDDRLEALAEVHALSQQTMALIQSNFRASVGINTGIMAGAAQGLLPPAATAVLHNGTTIGILLRALALGGGVGAVERPS